jgi:hypothetical protein
LLNISKIKGKMDKTEQNYLKAKITSKLIDNKTRDSILKETKNIRDLTILKAFFHFDEMDEEELTKILINE